MTPSSYQRLLATAAAVVVPAAVGHLLAGEIRTAAGLTLPPFVWPSLYVAHLVLALPLGLLVGARVAARSDCRDVSPVTWAVAGFAAVGLAAWVGPAVTDIAVFEGTGFLPMLLLRSAVALVLVLPWCVLAAPPSGGKWPVVVAAAGLAVLPCGLYADAAASARTEQARELIERERLVRARRTVIALRELGSERPVGRDAVGDLLGKLNDRVGRYEKVAARQLPADASPDARVERALTLIPLDRLAEAAALLEPQAGRGELDRLLLATVYQEQDRWRESDALFVGTMEGSGNSDAKATALDGLTFNARESRRPAEVETWLRRGLELFPDRAAEFHFKLGQHYAHAGRPTRAVDEFRAAADADPKRYGASARTRIDQLRTGTPACLLAPAAGRRI